MQYTSYNKLLPYTRIVSESDTFFRAPQDEKHVIGPQNSIPILSLCDFFDHDPMYGNTTIVCTQTIQRFEVNYICDQSIKYTTPVSEMNC